MPMESQMSSQSSTAGTEKEKLSCQHKVSIQLFFANDLQTQNQPWIRKHLPHGFSFHDGKIQESSTHTRGSTG